MKIQFRNIFVRRNTPLLFSFILWLGLCSVPGLSGATSVNIGETTVLTASDSGNGNLLLAQSATLSQSATINSLSFYVTKASGSLRLGLYDATGPGGGPGAFLAQTNGFTPTTGWNTANVITPVLLPAGTYWLAYLPSSSSLKFVKENNTGACAYYNYTYGAMPSTFNTSPNSCTPTQWSFYATFTPGTGTAVNGVCGSANGVAVTSAPTSNLCGTGTATAVSGSGPFNWSCDGSNGGSNATCSAPLLTAPVNGTCGPANGVEVASAPTTNLCGTGTASTVTESGTTLWDWSCSGSNGGTTATCSAPVQPTLVNGTCGSANGSDVTSAPSTNLCATGVATSVSGTGPWTWVCDGTSGGSDSGTCTALLLVNGTCGSANGVIASSAPASNLCSTGTSTAVTGTGPWAWSCDGSNGGNNASCSAPTQASAGTPTLVQHVSSSANPVGVGISGNNFKFTLPNPVGAGNVLILGMTYPHGSTPSITDTNGNTWPTKATVSADAGAGGNVSSIFVLPNAKAGMTTITVSLGSAVIPFEYTISEFNNVATVSPVSATSEAANISGPSLTSGSLDPANNNAGGGNLIWNYYAVSGGANGNPTSWVAGSNFTLLDADIAWINKQGFPHASQYYVQTTAAAMTPGITATGDGADGYNGVSVALMAAAAGTAAPSGIHVNKIIHETWTSLSSGATLTLQLPATGNLRVLTFAAGMNNIDITSITDSSGSTWNQAQTGGDSAQIWYAGNAPANSSLKVSIHTSGSSPTNSTRFFDIQGAAASPFDVAAGTDLTNCTSVTSINDQPAITPTATNELVIATMGIGDGPGLGLASGAPSGAVWDLVTYTGELDLDLMENADTTAHVYNTTTATENWNWQMTSNGNNSCSSEAVAFKAASPA